MNDLRGVLIPRDLAGPVGRLLAYAINRRNREDGVGPTPRMVALLRELDAVARSPYGSTPSAGASGDESWLSIAEAAAAMGCSPQYVRRLCRAGRVTARRVGREWLVSLPKPDQRAS
jgi:excisionase family DNA binding protein